MGPLRFRDGALQILTPPLSPPEMLSQWSGAQVILMWCGSCVVDKIIIIIVAAFIVCLLHTWCFT